MGYGTLFGISGRRLSCLSRQPRSVECTAFRFLLDNLTRAFTAVHSTQYLLSNDSLILQLYFGGFHIFIA